MRFALIFFICSLFFLPLFPVKAWAQNDPTPSLLGPLGLNIVPSARMEKPGTIRVSVSTLDPYIHVGLHAQIASPLSLSLRQSAEISGLNKGADRLYPGVDVKLRLREESSYGPELSVGLISALGHKRMAGEYLALSKRYKDFDFTVGAAWGRLGSAGHIKNPLGSLLDHFDKPRALDGEMPNAPDNWFTGPDIGFFAGVEYDTPWIEGLSLKADWGADRYVAERAAFGYDAPPPWSIGAHYAPREWINMGAALIGGQKLMGALSLQSPIRKWIGRHYKDTDSMPLYPERSDLALPGEIITSALTEGISLYDLRQSDTHSWVRLDTRMDHQPLPLQIGRVSRHIANHAGRDAEALLITPMAYGLEGRTLQIIRRDIEQAMAQQQGSPQEIWHGATLDAAPPQELTQGHTDLFRYTPETTPPGWRLRLILEAELSLSEEDSGVLYRTSLIAEERKHITRHIISGGALRFNIADNLGRLHDTRPQSVLPVRSNVDRFAQQTVSIDRLYTSFIKTIKPDLHMAITGGHLEEMYSGLGGEILYRPFGKRWALGAEIYQVFKRDPATFMSTGFTGDALLSGHVQGWYEFPESDLILKGRVGHYLAEDIGGTLALEKRFDNGAKLEAFLSATDQADFDLFGGTTHIYSGMKLALPLGNLKYLPESTEMRFKTAPQGRDTGQALDAPLPLYALTQPLSYRHIARHWNEIVE